MASSFEKSVKGATKSKTAPPKSKYIEHILIATHSGESGVAEVFRSLQHRIRDSTWTVALKSLITIHLMIREGYPDVTLSYLSRHPNLLLTSTFSNAQTQGRNIHNYALYLNERSKAYRETKCDFVRGAATRLEKLTVDKGLLRETAIVQYQITALLNCDVLDNEPENEITITVFRMLVLDLLAMFHAMNAGLINILGHFFEMSKTDAERSLEIYKKFTQQTEIVVQYLSTARQYEYQTRVEVPKLKHAPTNLGKQLEDYVLDSDFEANRRQYLAEQQSKSNKMSVSGTTKKLSVKSDAQPRTVASNDFPDFMNENATNVAKGPDPDLIDFFESIEQNQQPLATQTGLQQGAFDFTNTSQFQTQEQSLISNCFVLQDSAFAGYGQIQQNYNYDMTGQQGSVVNRQRQNSGEFIGFTASSLRPNGLPTIIQGSAANFRPQPSQQVATQNNVLQTTNPFRQSMQMSSSTGIIASPYPPASHITSPANRQSTNPFSKIPVNPSQDWLPSSGLGLQQEHNAPVMNPIQSTSTGTNPFAKPTITNAIGSDQKSQTGMILPQPTGGTNPFRQLNQNSSTAIPGWQGNQTPIGGGLDNLETIPVFPRPIQQLSWQ
ncbi:hypothetical protein K3495_g6491 [Podosphaera aphanis]|nr:hypothetical protein K3495_g6491 [Podosphaera aphanis]